MWAMPLARAITGSASLPSFGLRPMGCTFHIPIAAIAVTAFYFSLCAVVNGLVSVW